MTETTQDDNTRSLTVVSIIFSFDALIFTIFTISCWTIPGWEYGGYFFLFLAVTLVFLFITVLMWLYRYDVKHRSGKPRLISSIFSST